MLFRGLLWLPKLPMLTLLVIPALIVSVLALLGRLSSIESRLEGLLLLVVEFPRE